MEFLSLKGGCTGSSESTLVKIPHCWKSHVTAEMSFTDNSEVPLTFFKKNCVNVPLFLDNAHLWFPVKTCHS